MRIFIDDLQKVINENNNTSIELGVSDEVKNANSLINNYIISNFLVKINSKSYKYIGKEYENDIAYLYLELENVKIINSIKITDTMLMDYFLTQKNIVKLDINDVEKNFHANRKRKSRQVQFLKLLSLFGIIYICKKRKFAIELAVGIPPLQKVLPVWYLVGMLDKTSSKALKRP